MLLNLLQRSFQLFCNSLLTGHTGRRRLYNMIRRIDYESNLTDDVYMTVTLCESRARNDNWYRRKWPLQLFPACGLLAFEAIDILGPLPNISQGSQYVLIFTNRYSTLTRLTPTPRSNARRLDKFILDHCIIPFGNRTAFLTDEAFQFVNNFFCLCLHLSHTQATHHNNISPTDERPSQAL